MQHLMQWIGSKGAWACSRYSDLPELKYDVRSPAHHWCVVAGGLALILSRAGSGELSTRLRATGTLYELLRRRLRQGRRPGADASLVGEVMHETTELADPMTRASLAECFRECIKHSGAAEDTAPSALPVQSTMLSRNSSRSTSRHRSTQCDLEDAVTVISVEVLGQRSHNLRQALATARTGFAELK